MRLILAAGGGSSLSQPLDHMMATWMGTNPTMLYLPFAWTAAGNGAVSIITPGQATSGF